MKRFLSFIETFAAIIAVCCITAELCCEEFYLTIVGMVMYGFCLVVGIVILFLEVAEDIRRISNEEHASHV